MTKEHIRPKDLKVIEAKINNMKTKFAKPGRSTSAAEVTHISKHGIWVLVGEREYLLTKEDFPWFAAGKIAEVANVELLHGTYLR